jgi:hypothetical protein
MWCLFSVDNCHRLGYTLSNSRSRKGPAPEANGAVERGRCPRAELQTAPGQLRASASQHYRDWGARCSLDWDRSRAGNARINCVRCCPPEGGSLQIGAPPRPRKHGLKLGLREESSLRSEPRWNADRCAHPAGCAAVSAALHEEHCVCRRSASFLLCLAERASRTAKSRHHPFFSSAISFALQTWR